MKRCPQCNTVFEDEMLFCKEDGTPLIAETFSMPSDFTPEDHDDGEQETVMRYKPINFDISNPSVPKKTPQPQPHPQPQVNPYAPNHGNLSQPITQKPKGGCMKSFLILLIGLIIGGGAVLGIIGIGFVYMNKASNQNSNTEETVTNTSGNKTENNSNKKSSNKHSEPNKDINENKLNGQIIKKRAILRSSPSNKSKRLDTLPNNDRLVIIKRENPTSRWYEVECEHGSRGWIDGYSIKFTE